MACERENFEFSFDVSERFQLTSIYKYFKYSNDTQVAPQISRPEISGFSRFTSSFLEFLSRFLEILKKSAEEIRILST